MENVQNSGGNGKVPEEIVLQLIINCYHVKMGYYDSNDAQQKKRIENRALSIRDKLIGMGVLSNGLNKNEIYHRHIVPLVKEDLGIGSSPLEIATIHNSDFYNGHERDTYLAFK